MFPGKRELKFHNNVFASNNYKKSKAEYLTNYFLEAIKAVGEVYTYTKRQPSSYKLQIIFFGIVI